VTCQFSDVRNVFDFVSLRQPWANEAYLDRETGAIYRQSDHTDLSDALLPDAIDDTDRYVPVPHKTDLSLGKPLGLQFTAQYLPAQLDHVRAHRQPSGRGCALQGMTDRSANAERLTHLRAELV